MSFVWVNWFSFFLMLADGAWQLQGCKTGMSVSVCFPDQPTCPASLWCQWYQESSQSQPFHHSPSVQEKVVLVLPSNAGPLEHSKLCQLSLPETSVPGLLYWLQLCVFLVLAISSLTRWVPTLNTFARGLFLPLDCSAQNAGEWMLA